MKNASDSVRVMVNTHGTWSQTQIARLNVWRDWKLECSRIDTTRKKELADYWKQVVKTGKCSYDVRDTTYVTLKAKTCEVNKSLQLSVCAAIQISIPCFRTCGKEVKGSGKNDNNNWKGKWTRTNTNRDRCAVGRRSYPSDISISNTES